MTIDRRDLTRQLVRARGDALIVTGLGSATWDVAAAGDAPEHFYLWGAMGNAAVTGLGLALARPERRVVVVTGDGELLMSLGSLATIAAAAPRNLGLLVLDNQAFGETGGQPSPTAAGVDLATMAAGAGFPVARRIVAESAIPLGIETLLHAEGPALLLANVRRDPTPLVLPTRDAVRLKLRMRDLLGGALDRRGSGDGAP